MSVYEKKEDGEGGIILKCDCGHEQHQLNFEWIRDIAGEVSPLCIGVNLTKQRFFRRLKFAFRYLFCVPSGYGAYEESVIDNSEDVEKVIKFLENYLKEKESGA